MKIKTGLSIASSSDDRVWIYVEDKTSGVQFLRLSISHENFSRALGNLAGVECEAEVVGTDVLGMEYVGEKRKIDCPLDTFDRPALVEWLKENAQEEGWILNSYLGSQGSVSFENEKRRKDGARGCTLNYTVYKYVKPQQAPKKVVKGKK